MRNLKKILALVLALVMSLSLMATASAAETSTASSDSYATAKEVLEGLEVFRGDEGGMRYDASVTRAETAALVYRVATSDVKDTQKDLYTAHPFIDVKGTTSAWADGYIAYGYNAEILKGNGDNTFTPGSNVTGYQVLAMVLRTMGYGRNHEFEGVNWEIQTAATARQEGLLNGVLPSDEATLGLPASRGLVAQILFNALLQPTAHFNINTPYNYQKDAETLGYQKFQLREVYGVVMANEYADLEGTSTLDANETRFADLNSEESYTVTNKATGLDDIGESRLVYIQNGTKVLSYGDSGLNGIGDTDMKADDLKDLKKDANATGDGDHFINFDRVGDRISDYRIKYVLNGDTNKLIGNLTLEAVRDRINAAAGETNSRTARAQLIYDNAGDPVRVEVTITPKTNITNVDLSYIRAIFGEADAYTTGNNLYYLDGEVYVGSQSYTDISDVTNDNFKYSYDRFVSEFIYTKDGTVVTGNENGNYVKVIDNNGDGKVDYVLKTVYTFALVERVKDGEAILDTTNHTLMVGSSVCGVSSDVVNNLTTQPVHNNSDAELAKDDVVYYAVIDGKAQTWKAETVTKTIERVDHNTLVTTTTDGDEYPQSGVHEHIEDDAYMSGCRNLAGKVSYDLYFDRAGNLGVFIKTDKAGTYKLITDAWYNRLRDSKEFAVKVYDTTDKVQKTVELNDTYSSLFIFDNSNSVIQNNNWGALKWFGGSDTGSRTWTNNGITSYAALNGDGDKVHTTIAAIADDGTILPVENNSVTGRYLNSILDIQGDKVPTNNAVKGTVYSTTNGSSTAYNVLGDNGDRLPVNGGWTYDVRALDTTDYYVVYPVGNGSDVEVIYSQGYANAPDLTSDNSPYKGIVEDIYAVGTLREAENSLGVDRYYIADAVVVELTRAPSDSGSLVFVVDDLARYETVRYRDVRIIDGDGKDTTIKVDWTGNWTNTLSYVDGIDNSKRVMPGFYYMHDVGDGVYTLTNSSSDAYAYNQPLTAAQIRDTGVVTVGHAEKGEWTRDHKYLIMQSYNWNTDNDGFEQNPGVSYTMSDSTSLYTLKYDVDYNTNTFWNWLTNNSMYATLRNFLSNYQDSNPVLAKIDGENAEDVLAARVNETLNDDLYREDPEHRLTHNRTNYNYNDILVVHNGKGAATYVVSFENIYRDGTILDDDYREDFAQAIWSSLIPAAKVDEYDVTFGTFYGMTFGLDEFGKPIVTGTVDVDGVAVPVKATGGVVGNRGAVEYEMSYADAKAWANSQSATTLSGLNFFTTANGNGLNNISILAPVPVPVAGVPNIVGMDEISFTIDHKVGNNVISYTYHLSVAPAKGYGTELKPDGTYLMSTTGNTLVFSSSVTGNTVPLSTIVSAVKNANTDLWQKGESIDFIFCDDSTGGVIDPNRYGDFHYDNTSNIIITVTDENGDIEVYTEKTTLNKIVVVETSDGIVLADNQNVRVDDIQQNPDGSYTVTVRAQNGVTPVLVVGNVVFKMDTADGQTLALTDKDSKVWTCTLPGDVLKGINVVYVRAEIEKNEGIAPPADTAVEEAKKALETAVADAETYLGTLQAKLEELKKAEEPDAEEIAKYEAAINALDTAIKANKAKLDDDTATAEILNNAAAAVEAAVEAAQDSTGEVPPVTYTVTKGTVTGTGATGVDFKVEPKTAKEDDTVTVTVDGAAEDATVTVTAVYTDAENAEQTITAAEGETGYTFSMPAADVTVNVNVAAADGTFSVVIKANETDEIKATFETEPKTLTGLTGATEITVTITNKDKFKSLEYSTDGGTNKTAITDGTFKLTATETTTVVIYGVKAEVSGLDALKEAGKEWIDDEVKAIDATALSDAQNTALASAATSAKDRIDALVAQDGMTDEDFANIIDNIKSDFTKDKNEILAQSPDTPLIKENTIEVKYHLGEGETEYTQQMLLDSLAEVDPDSDFEILAWTLTAGEATGTAVQVRNNNEEVEEGGMKTIYSVKITRVFEVKLDGKVMGYVTKDGYDANGATATTKLKLGAATFYALPKADLASDTTMVTCTNGELSNAATTADKDLWTAVAVTIPSNDGKTNLTSDVVYAGASAGAKTTAIPASGGYVQCGAWVTVASVAQPDNMYTTITVANTADTELKNAQKSCTNAARSNDLYYKVGATDTGVTVAVSYQYGLCIGNSEPVLYAISKNDAITMENIAGKYVVVIGETAAAANNAEITATEAGFDATNVGKIIKADNAVDGNITLVSAVKVTPLANTNMTYAYGDEIKDVTIDTASYVAVSAVLSIEDDGALAEDTDRLYVVCTDANGVETSKELSAVEGVYTVNLVEDYAEYEPAVRSVIDDTAEIDLDGVFGCEVDKAGANTVGFDSAFNLNGKFSAITATYSVKGENPNQPSDRYNLRVDDEGTAKITLTAKKDEYFANEGEYNVVLSKAENENLGVPTVTVSEDGCALYIEFTFKIVAAAEGGN